MALCLVTGGAGFLGSHLAEALVRLGHDVRVLDDFSSGRTAHLVALTGRVEVVVGDVADADVVRPAVHGVDYVFHLAACGANLCEDTDPIKIQRACATGTLVVLMASRDAGVRRLVYAGSASAYGLVSHKPVRETDLPCPISTYAAAKLAGEHYCAAFSRAYGLETVVLRLFNVFGPRMIPNSYAAPVPHVVRALRAGERPVIQGDGLRPLDFTEVSDAVQGFQLAMEAPRVAGRTYNIGGGLTCLVELVRLLNGSLGTRLPPVRGRNAAPDFRQNRPDTCRAQAELGYCPVVTLEDGLRRYLAAELAFPAEPALTAPQLEAERPTLEAQM